mmetsp:Transcript_55255/g.123508  ORF Transcript_55255/g.123508 Transcript_55255/m.123508 type:complete len:146 (-) Transcript_55255:505-942(-)
MHMRMYMLTRMCMLMRMLIRMRMRILMRMRMHIARATHVFACPEAQAFDDLYYLERAGQVQVLALSTGRDPVIISDAVALATKLKFDEEKSASARLHLDAQMRTLMRTDAGYLPRSAWSFGHSFLTLAAAAAAGAAVMLPLTRVR